MCNFEWLIKPPWACAFCSIKWEKFPPLRVIVIDKWDNVYKVEYGYWHIIDSSCSCDDYHAIPNTDTIWVSPSIGALFDGWDIPSASYQEYA